MLTQWGLRISLQRLRAPDAMTLLEQRGMPAVWRRSIAEALDVIELLDARIAPLDRELAPLARADARVVLLDTIPGVGDLLGLTLASEIGDVARFGSPRKLIGYAGLAPKISQSGDRSHTGALSKAGSRTLRWAAVEPAQHAWRPTWPHATAAHARSAPPARLSAPAPFWPPRRRPCMELRSRDNSHEHSARTRAPKEK